jgi:ribose transport system substrate-binding protein
MKIRQMIVAALLALACCGVAACGSSDDDDGGAETTAAASTTTTADGGAGTCDVEPKLQALASGDVMSRGPYGETAVPAKDVTLTDEEIERIRGMGATAALVMHFGGNDWTNAQVAGARAQFEKMGIEIVAVTQADGKADKQVNDLETVMAKRPDIILSVPIDPVATASAYRKAAEQGARIVFLDVPAKDLRAGSDYVSVVSADNYGNGVASAHLLARALDCKGEVGAIHFADASNFAVEARWQAFQDTLASDYPEMEIVESQDVNAPDFAGDSEKAASAMLTKHPDLDGIWAWFDVPAEGSIQAVGAAGRDDVAITTVDLGLNVAIDIAEGGLVKGLGAQLPYDQGVTEAIVAGYALLGKEAPPYIALPPLPVYQENVLEAWEQVYHAPPPGELAEAAGG